MREFILQKVEIKDREPIRPESLNEGLTLELTFIGSGNTQSYISNADIVDTVFGKLKSIEAPLYREIICNVSEVVINTGKRKGALMFLGDELKYLDKIKRAKRLYQTAKVMPISHAIPLIELREEIKTALNEFYLPYKEYLKSEINEIKPKYRTYGYKELLRIVECIDKYKDELNMLYHG